MRMTLLLAFLFALTAVSSCKLFGDDDEGCACPAPEICVDGVCQLPEGTIRLGNWTFSGPDTYLGVLPERFCTDSIVLRIEGERDEFVLHSAETTELNAFGVGLLVLDQPSDDRYVFAHTIPFCEDESGLQLRATITADLFEPDSVQLNIRFWDDPDAEIMYYDSTQLTMVKL